MTNLQLNFSIIIPVYNRPQEIEELLASIVQQTFNERFEVVIVEDGSSIPCENELYDFRDKLNLKYLVKENEGPGLSRNHGMQNASGNYFIILDSDTLLPTHYLSVVHKALMEKFTDAYGGADASHPSFSILQKAINYSMTSVLTTGGLRGNKNLKKFQPRSFNMGLSDKAFQKTAGFSAQNYGEDIDLTFRLWQSGFESQFIEKAFVYHKRKNSLSSFLKQTLNFGAARPLLNAQYPDTSKLTYWFPSVFIVGMLFSIVTFFLGYRYFLLAYALYFALVFFDSSVKNRNLFVGLLSVWTTLIQFVGYGIGFLRSFIRLNLLNYNREKAFPRMFR